MAHDRLAELRRGRESESPAGRGGGGKGGGHDDVEMGAGSFMQNFFDEAGDIKKTMARMFTLTMEKVMIYRCHFSSRKAVLFRMTMNYSQN